MIKLFWNTHNQKKPSSTNKKIREKEELDYGWGQYHKKSSNKSFSIAFHFWMIPIIESFSNCCLPSMEESESRACSRESAS